MGFFLGGVGCFVLFYFVILYNELINTAIGIFPEKGTFSLFSLIALFFFSWSWRSNLLSPEFMISSEMCRWNVF